MWSLQTLEEIPQGAYLAEYVGEILTKLYDMNDPGENEK